MKSNAGFDAQAIQSFKEQLKDAPFTEVQEADSSDEFRHIRFLGSFEGRAVVFDAIVYTLRFQHELELYEMAEHEAAKYFDNYKKLQYQEDENGDLRTLDSDEEAIGLYMAEVIMELQEEEVVKVKEHVEVDTLVEFGVGLSVGLHHETITDQVLERFIEAFNRGALQLDDTWYSFQQEGEES